MSRSLKPYALVTGAAGFLGSPVTSHSLAVEFVQAVELTNGLKYQAHAQ